MCLNNISIKRFNELTTEELYDILKLRSMVFVVEQNCPYLDMDDKDHDAIHVYLRINHEIVAYARILNPNVSSPYITIGRVVTRNRLQGYGKSIMEASIDYIRENTNEREIYIMAQIQAKAFYEKLGFVKYGEEFLEDDIPHCHMKLIL